jgi:hypothetical protein
MCVCDKTGFDAVAFFVQISKEFFFAKVLSLSSSAPIPQGTWNQGNAAFTRENFTPVMMLKEP